MIEKSCIYIYINIGKAEPEQYISTLPNTYDHHSYNVIPSTGYCVRSMTIINNSDTLTLTCQHGEQLLDRITQVNLEDGVTNSDIQRFYTWEDHTNNDEAFVTLQFSNNAIKATKVSVYCLESNDLDACGPSHIRLYSSTTNSTNPVEILGIDINSEVIRSGRASQIGSYEFRRYNAVIPEGRQVFLNELRISMEFSSSHDWLFISEVEVYHLLEPCK